MQFKERRECQKYEKGSDQLYVGKRSMVHVTIIGLRTHQKKKKSTHTHTHMHTHTHTHIHTHTYTHTHIHTLIPNKRNIYTLQFIHH
jgi:hypothetical protein